MSKIAKFFWFVLAFWGVIALSVLAASVAAMLPSAPGADSSELGIVRIEGVIIDASQVLEDIRYLKDEVGVKGIVIRVESPGGAVAASQEIYAKLEQLRADSFPIVASYGNISASGGYYSTLPAEVIFASSGTLTGSIGVITEFMHGEKLMEKIGVEASTVTSGKLKSAGSPYRAPSDSDLAYFQDVVDDTHRQFVSSVAKWRKIAKDSLAVYADGRVFTGRRAQELGLIDSLGGLDASVAWLSKRCHLEQVPSTLEEVIPQKPLLKELMEGVESSISPLLGTGAKVLWKMP